VNPIVGGPPFANLLSKKGSLEKRKSNSAAKGKVKLDQASRQLKSVSLERGGGGEFKKRKEAGNAKKGLRLCFAENPAEEKLGFIT